MPLTGLNLYPVWDVENPPYFDSVIDFLSHDNKLLWRVSFDTSKGPMMVRHALYRRTMVFIQGKKQGAWEPAVELSMGEVRSHADLMRRVADWCEENPGHPKHDHGSRYQAQFQADGTIAPLGSLDD